MSAYFAALCINGPICSKQLRLRLLACRAASAFRRAPAFRRRPSQGSRPSCSRRKPAPNRGCRPGKGAAHPRSPAPDPPASPAEAGRIRPPRAAPARRPASPPARFPSPERARGRGSPSCAQSANRRIWSNRLSVLPEDGPSVPSPKRTPARAAAAIGAMPLPAFVLLPMQWAMAAFPSARISMSVRASCGCSAPPAAARSPRRFLPEIARRRFPALREDTSSRSPFRWRAA